MEEEEEEEEERKKKKKKEEEKEGKEVCSQNKESRNRSERRLA